MPELAKRKREEGSSKRKVAAELGIDESTLRKRLKAGSGGTSLGRFNQFLLKLSKQN
jgi:DNA invertase Pin-like site-specific DNA recombinase